MVREVSDYMRAEKVQYELENHVGTVKKDSKKIGV